MISVVIPMYNASNTILSCVESVLNQSFKGDLEIIVVNDGSTDESLKILTNFCDFHKLFNLIILNKVNGGVSSARNMGIKKAQGKYIAFLDSDDRWETNKLEKQLEVFEENPDVDLLATNRNGEKIDSFFWLKFDRLTKIDSRLLLLKNFFSPPTVMMKREIVYHTGYFDEKQKYAEEGDFWIRICKENSCYLLNESLAITGEGKPYFGHSGLSSNLWEMEKGELKNIRTALRLKIINPVEYCFLSIFSVLKYFRRWIIVRLRK